MDYQSILDLLNEQIRDLREISILRREDMDAQQALRRIDVLWKRACKLAQVSNDESIGLQRRTTLWAIIRISRETAAEKRTVFAGSGGDEPLPGFGEVEGDGGAGVGARIRPRPPSRSGRDAKPFPPEELLIDPDLISGITTRGNADLWLKDPRS